MEWGTYDVRQLSLDGVVLIKQDLRGWNLRDMYCAGADLRGVDLSAADCRGISLEHANLTGASVAGADFRRSNLQHANLTGVDLQGARLNVEERAALETADPATRGDRFLGGLGRGPRGLTRAGTPLPLCTSYPPT